MDATPPVLTQHRGGSGPPLVLLHGLGLSWRWWRPVLGALERRHEVVALDLPGFGASPPLRDARPTPARLADAVERELDSLGLDAPALVGNSLGGWLALELARRGRAARVVAIAPSGLELPPERAYVIALNELMRLRARVGAREAAREVRTFGRSPGFQATLAWTVGASVPGFLAEVRVPVRIAFGTHDVMLGAFTAPRFAAAIPGAELVPLPGLGHVPMHDDPARVARTILTFTAEPPPDAG